MSSVPQQVRLIMAELSAQLIYLPGIQKKTAPAARGSDNHIDIHHI